MENRRKKQCFRYMYIRVLRITHRFLPHMTQGIYISLMRRIVPAEHLKKPDTNEDRSITGNVMEMPENIHSHIHFNTNQIKSRRFSHWLFLLFPTKEQGKQLFRSCISKKDVWHCHNSTKRNENVHRIYRFLIGNDMLCFRCLLETLFNHIDIWHKHKIRLHPSFCCPSMFFLSSVFLFSCFIERFRSLVEWNSCSHVLCMVTNERKRAYGRGSERGRERVFECLSVW